MLHCHFVTLLNNSTQEGNSLENRLEEGKDLLRLEDILLPLPLSSLPTSLPPSHSPSPFLFLPLSPSLLSSQLRQQLNSQQQQQTWAWVTRWRENCARKFALNFIEVGWSKFTRFLYHIFNHPITTLLPHWLVHFKNVAHHVTLSLVGSDTRSSVNVLYCKTKKLD